MTDSALCDAWVDFRGERYECERDDEHDGTIRMHGADMEGEWTNWSDEWPNAGRAGYERDRKDA